MSFFQIAIKNVTRNTRSYLAFYLSSSFAVMIFYLFAMFIFHPSLEEGYINNIAQKGMMAAEWIIFCFSILFVLYSLHAFLQNRKKAIGILIITGMSPKQLRLMLTLENMLIGLAAIVSGIIGGTILAKMFFVAGSYVLEMEPLPLYFPFKAIGITFSIFLILFLIISQFTLFLINSEQTVAQLKESQLSKKEPKPSRILSLLALVFLSLAYGMALFGEIDMKNAVLILIFTVLGTYLFFSQVSVWVLKLLKRNKQLYFRGYHLLSISDLAYRLKDNARLFFIVSIVSTVAFTATGVLAVFKSNMDTEYTGYEIEYLSFPENTQDDEHINTIQNTLESNGIAYEYDQLEVLYARYAYKQGKTPPILIVSQQQLSKLSPSMEKVSLKDGEGIAFLDSQDSVVSSEEIPSKLNMVNPSISITIKEQESSLISLNNILAVNNNTFEEMKTALTPSTLYGFNYKNWKESLSITQDLQKQFYGNYSNVNLNFTAKAIEYFQTVQLPSLSLFIGLFVALVFFLAAGSFLYFRLFTDLENEQDKYKGLSKIGLTEREMKNIVTWQLGILFFFPFLVATIHTGFALKVLERDAVLNVFMPSVMTILGFLVIQVIYFIIVRFSYIKKLSESIKN